MSERHSEAASAQGSHAATNGAAAVSVSKGGGFKAWLPLLFAVISMPALAYATTTFLIVPQIQRAIGHAGGEGGEAPKPGASGGHGKAAGHGGVAEKQTVALNKMIVNVAGTMGTRYLMTSVTLVGATADFKSQVEHHRDHLLDVATSTLSNKTIAELETPGARNQVRTELQSGFNTVLGANAVQEIFITEFAIQ